MNRKERRAAQRRGGPAASSTAATLASAFRAHQSGHRADAERRYRDVLTAEPRNAAALHLLGVLAHQGGRTDEAVALINQALAVEPRNPDFHYNLGSILQTSSRLEDAVSHFKKAIALNPKHIEAHFELAGVLARLARWPDAAASFRRVLAVKPNDAATLNNLGMVLREQGQLDEAIALWQRAVAASASYHLAHMNLGLAYKTQRRFDEAAASLHRALELAPGASEVIYNLAVMQMDQGRHDDAMRTTMRGLEKSETAELRALFVTCLQTMPRVPVDDRIRNLIARAMTEGRARPDQLAAVAASFLKSNPVIASSIALVNKHSPRPVPVSELLPPGNVAAIAQDDLLAAALTSAPVTDIDLERVLTGLRFALLAAARNAGKAITENELRLSCALARQCFLNGYVWAQSDDDTARLRDLQNTIADALQNGRSPEAHWLAAIASHVPLHILPFADRLLGQGWSGPMDALLDQQIREPAEERAIRASIPVLDTKGASPGDDAPSPRWVSAAPQRRPVTIDAYLRHGFPHAGFRPLGKSGPLDILVAGCGTGQSAIEIAGRHAAPNVLAVDPSAANLAYAARQAMRYGRSNISFSVCDDPQALPQAFDVIDAVGAVKAATDAAAMLAALASLLRPNGFMLVAIDGERIQEIIKAGQDFVRDGNYQPDDEGVRLLRQNILRLPQDHSARALASRAEFHTTPTCRDLLFRSLDRPLRLAGAGAAFEGAALVPVGFDVDRRLGELYRKKFPNDPQMVDLTNWQSLEKAEPDMSAMTYNIWLQKT